MASQGVVFRNSVSQATWTKVSTPSMMTSTYPITNGVVAFMDRLPAAATTLAEVYYEAGYATVSFASNLFTGQFTALHQGFEEVHEDGSLTAQRSSKTSREYVDRAVDWLERHRDTPFFIFLHLYDPHDPFEPRRPWDTTWADPDLKEIQEKHYEEMREHIKDPMARSFGMPSREELLEAGIDPDAYISHDKDWYDGSIRGMDTEIGRLLEKLEALGLADSTLVVFTADHGEEFFDHGRTFHGQSVYGELTRVPLIMRWPAGLPAGVSIDETVEIIDVMPTILELNGLPQLEGQQGASLVPLLRARGGGSGQAFASEGNWESRPAFSEKAVTEPGSGAPWPHHVEAYSVVDGPWKLIHHVVPDEGNPEFELFKFHDDPLDQINLAAEHPDVVERLAKAIRTWRKKAEAARLPSDSESTEGLSNEQLERLRSLGYIQ